MAKVLVVGNVGSIVSDFALEDLETVAKYRPEALALTDEKTGAVTFRVSVSEKPSIGTYGVEFSKTPTAEGKATVPIVIPNTGGAAIKDNIADAMGNVLSCLNAIESALPESVEKAKAQKEEILSSITIM